VVSENKEAFAMSKNFFNAIDFFLSSLPATLSQIIFLRTL